MATPPPEHRPERANPHEKSATNKLLDMSFAQLGTFLGHTSDLARLFFGWAWAWAGAGAGPGLCAGFLGFLGLAFQIISAAFVLLTL